MIRRDFDTGMSERAVERKHHVGRRTIVKALDSAAPPARKRIHREPEALKCLHGHIDAMIETNAIATVAYPTLRAYVVSRRAPNRSLRRARPGA